MRSLELVKRRHCIRNVFLTSYGGTNSGFGDGVNALGLCIRLLNRRKLNGGGGRPSLLPRPSHQINRRCGRFHEPELDSGVRGHVSLCFIDAVRRKRSSSSGEEKQRNPNERHDPFQPNDINGIGSDHRQYASKFLTPSHCLPNVDATKAAIFSWKWHRLFGRS